MTERVARAVLLFAVFLGQGCAKGASMDADPDGPASAAGQGGGHSSGGAGGNAAGSGGRSAVGSSGSSAGGADADSGASDGGTSDADAAPDRCSDGSKNGFETATDCGGPECDECATGASCVTSDDCEEGSCELSVCTAAPDDAGADGGGAGSGSCASTSADADGDGLPDCEEDDDDDPATEADVFNGVHVRQADQCSAAGECSENDTLGEVIDCMSDIREEQDQSAGWSWSDDPPDDLCEAEYRFEPAWTDCNDSWALDWQGYVYLTEGHHCFQLAGEADEDCGALYFVDGEASGFGGWDDLPESTAANAQTGDSAVCFTISDEGSYPVRWHYTMDDGAHGTLQLLYCGDEAADCTPSAPLPSRMLRVAP